MAAWSATGAVELVSPLSLDECCDRLRTRMDSRLTLFGSKPVIGRIDRTRLRARKRIQYRNSFQTLLSAELVERAGQTRIRCRFSLHPFVAVFMAMWLGGVAVAGGGSVALSLAAIASAPSQAPSGAWVGLAVPVAMLAFGFGLLGLGRHLARGERAFLIGFVREATDARQADAGGPSG